MQVHRQPTIQQHLALGQARHRLEEQSQVFEVLLELGPVLVTEAFIQVVIDGIGRIEHNGCVQAAVHHPRRRPCLLLGKLVALVCAHLDVALAADAARGFIQGLRQRQVHDTADRCDAGLLLDLLEAHAQVELQQLNLSLQHVISADRRGPVPAKVVRDQRVELGGQHLEFLGVGVLLLHLRLDRVQDGLAFAYLRLRELAHRCLVRPPTTSLLGLHNVVLPIDRLEAVACGPRI
mmetsp:Transcript_13022/g.35735  ORF Transcript_13022/g.35735 Transcript_13022/m.35735 type:complete len:235 (+) Transcript_13022:379-1083(+)